MLWIKLVLRDFKDPAHEKISNALQFKISFFFMKSPWNNSKIEKFLRISIIFSTVNSYFNT